MSQFIPAVPLQRPPGEEAPSMFTSARQGVLQVIDYTVNINPWVWISSGATWAAGNSAFWGWSTISTIIPAVLACAALLQGIAAFARAAHDWYLTLTAGPAPAPKPNAKPKAKPRAKKATPPKS